MSQYKFDGKEKSQDDKMTASTTIQHQVKQWHPTRRADQSTDQRVEMISSVEQWIILQTTNRKDMGRWGQSLAIRGKTTTATCADWPNTSNTIHFNGQPKRNRDHWSAEFENEGIPTFTSHRCNVDESARRAQFHACNRPTVTPLTTTAITGQHETETTNAPQWRWDSPYFSNEQDPNAKLEIQCTSAASVPDTKNRPIATRLQRQDSQKKCTKIHVRQQHKSERLSRENITSLTDRDTRHRYQLPDPHGQTQQTSSNTNHGHKESAGECGR